MLAVLVLFRANQFWFPEAQSHTKRASIILWMINIFLVAVVFLHLKASNWLLMDGLKVSLGIAFAGV